MAAPSLSLAPLLEPVDTQAQALLPVQEAPELTSARRWFGVAVSVLMLAGFFALAVVAARMPPLDTLVTDPEFFRRCLVVHVNLALVCWFYAFTAHLLFLLPGRDQSSRWSRGAVWVAVTGLGAMALAAALPSATPILSNYVPTLDHPLFWLGQGLFGLGVLGSFLDRRLMPADPSEPGLFDLPASSRCGLRAAALALLLAAATFAATWARMPAGLDPTSHAELLFWGTGHVLQAASVLAMLSVWALLLKGLLGHSPVRTSTASALFLVLLVPWNAAPALALIGPWTTTSRLGFTRLMEWAIFPVVVVFLGLCLRSLWRAARSGGLDRRALLDPRLTGFAASATLTVLGFVLGACIRGSNTMVPAHYHAALGGVTVAFMAAAIVLMPRLGLPLPTDRTRRLASWQPLVYGSGQALFALGFALAGANGMARKVYGSEQAQRTVVETAGLGIMGIGGLIAVAGGVLFLVIVSRAWWARHTLKSAWRTA